MMRHDKAKVRDVVLALMFLTTFKEASGYRAWKAYDWEVLDDLYLKGYIGNPKTKVRSVDLTEEGRARSEQLFNEMFSPPGECGGCGTMKASLAVMEVRLAKAEALGNKVRVLLVDEYKCLGCHETFNTLKQDEDHYNPSEGLCPYCDSDAWTTTL